MTTAEDERSATADQLAEAQREIASLTEAVARLEAVEDGQWYKIGGVGYIFHDLVQPSPPAE